MRFSLHKFSSGNLDCKNSLSLVGAWTRLIIRLEDQTSRLELESFERSLDVFESSDEA
jgi:hypothetical protein